MSTLKTETSPSTMAARPNTLASIVDMFNERSKSELLVLKKCSELIERKHYIVHSMVKTTHEKYGDSILVKLSDAPYCEGDKPKFQLYLPSRFVTLLQNVDLRLVTPGSVYLVSHGMSGVSPKLELHLVGPANC